MRTVLSMLFLCFFLATYAQGELDPVQWTFESEKIGENEYKISFKAEIEEGWAVYSQFIDEGGPIPTTFTYEDLDGINLIGGVVEPEDKESKYDEMFEMELIKIKGNATFFQLVTTSKESPVLKGYLTFMSCDDSKCLPPSDVEFEITVE